MTILRDISLLWTMIHVLILFIFFYESRYNRKKTVILTMLVMTPIVILNMLGVVYLGVEIMGQLLVVTCTIPSLIFFFCIAKNHNWKFFFTFCVVDTISYEILVITNLLDYYLPGDIYLTMFILRLIAYPLMEWIAYKYLRKPYLKFQANIKSGWGIFTIVTAIYYVLLILMVHFPTMITDRPKYIPAVIVLLILMPITYMGMFVTLREQMRLMDAERRENILKIQTSMLEQRIEHTSELEEQMKIQRHDMRHRYSILASMIKAGKKEEALEYISKSESVLDDMNSSYYCNDPVINAVFEHFCQKADAEDIHIDLDLTLPKEFAFNTTELSVVFANVLENAIHANMSLPRENRCIKCRCVNSPQFMFQISNPFVGEIHMNEDGIPTTDKFGHGTGIRSIMAFCSKNDVYSEFKIEDGWFTFRMTKA